MLCSSPLLWPFQSLKNLKHPALTLLIFSLLTGCNGSSSSGSPLSASFDKANCQASGSLGQEVSAVFIGNSLSYGISERVDFLLECAGYTSRTTNNAVGSSRLCYHAPASASQGLSCTYAGKDAARTTQLIEQGFDFVVLQEHSSGLKAQNSSPYSVLNKLKEQSDLSQADLLFYQTWGYKDNTSSLNAVIDGYEEVAADIGGNDVVEVGRAWKAYLEQSLQDQTMDLFDDDRHASKYGQALTAYVFYLWLTQGDTTPISNLDLSQEQANALHQIAISAYNARQ